MSHMEKALSVIEKAVIELCFIQNEARMEAMKQVIAGEAEGSQNLLNAGIISAVLSTVGEQMNWLDREMKAER